MSKRPQEEAKLWQRLNAKRLSNVKAYRFEARSPSGVSDVYWTYRPLPGDTLVTHLHSLTGWVELKSQVNFVRADQRLWLLGMADRGVPARVAAEWGDLLYLINPEKIGLDLKIPFDQAILSIPTHTADKELWATFWRAIVRNDP